MGPRCKDRTRGWPPFGPRSDPIATAGSARIVSADFAFLALALPMDDTELLTVSQVAEALSASSQTIRNWIRAEQLRAVRIGSRFLIPRGEVDRLRGDMSGAPGESPWDFDLSDSDAPLSARRRACHRGRFRGIVSGRLMPDSEQAFQEARRVWREALRGHVLAPPDPGFSARLSALAAAATQRAAACEAAYKDGFEWPVARGGAQAALRAAAWHRPPWSRGAIEALRRGCRRTRPRQRGPKHPGGRSSVFRAR